MAKLVVAAKVEFLDSVIDFVNEELEAAGCGVSVQTQVDISVEEIFVNICHYAYHPEEGEASVECTVAGDPLQVCIEFIDRGKKFNPLDKGDPDTTLQAEERDIGGLGIFMVKNIMDEVTYNFTDGKNILTIKKNI